MKNFISKRRTAVYQKITTFLSMKKRELQGSDRNCGFSVRKSKNQSSRDRSDKNLHATLKYFSRNGNCEPICWTSSTHNTKSRQMFNSYNTLTLLTDRDRWMFIMGLFFFFIVLFFKAIFNKTMETYEFSKYIILSIQIDFYQNLTFFCLLLMLTLQRLRWAELCNNDEILTNPGFDQVESIVELSSQDAKSLKTEHVLTTKNR